MLRRRPRRAFTLLEILTVLGILSLLAALLLPVVGTVRGRARQTACLNNLRQLGAATALYLQDFDNYYPRAVDAEDRLHPQNWAEYPEFQAQIAAMPSLPEALRPYAPSAALFHCPSDTGLEFSEFTGQRLDALPTSFAAHGSSYYYRTEMAAERYLESQVATAAQINLYFDGSGRWHGTRFPDARRYNVLFADLHAKNVSHEQMEAAWLVKAAGPAEQRGAGAFLGPR